MNKFIYNQRQIPREQYRYGFRSSAAVGCGWVAVYNALLLLGREANISSLIRDLEGQIPLLHGNAGTAFWGPAVLLRKWGYHVLGTGRRQNYDAQAAGGDACILFYHWRSGIKLGSHFVALHKTERGFVGYNTYANSVGPDFYGESLETFLKKQGYFGTFLWVIKK